MEEVELSIATYKSQLEQVKLALAASQDDENKDELTQLASGKNWDLSFDYVMRPFCLVSHIHKMPLQMWASSLFYLMRLLYHYHQLFIDI